MMNLSATRYGRMILLAARWVLGLVFVVAAIDKIGTPEIFAGSIEAYKILPLAIVNVFALVLPWIELLCGLFLLAGVRLRASAFLLSMLLILFVFAILSAMMRNLNIDCGCFGTHATPIGWGKVAEDLGLLVLSVVIYLDALPRTAEERPPQNLPG